MDAEGKKRLLFLIISLRTINQHSENDNLQKQENGNNKD